MPIPAGVFVPVFVMGGALGRAVGEVMVRCWFYCCRCFWLCARVPVLVAGVVPLSLSLSRSLSLSLSLVLALSLCLHVSLCICMGVSLTVLRRHSAHGRWCCMFVAPAGSCQRSGSVTRHSHSRASPWCTVSRFRTASAVFQRVAHARLISSHRPVCCAVLCCAAVLCCGPMGSAWLILHTRPSPFRLAYSRSPTRR